MNQIEIDKKRGFFITFEGPEGAGKSTQIAMLSEELRRRGFEIFCTREPGGTPLAEELRKLVKGFTGREKLHAATELLLIEAARAQHVREVIAPKLSAGTTVLCDRFYDSTTAYQGAARGIDEQVIDALNAYAACGCRPDLTLFLDLPPETGFCRTSRRSETLGERDRFESAGIEFHRAVYRAYCRIAEREPQRVKKVAADSSPELIHQNIMRIVDELI